MPEFSRATREGLSRLLDDLAEAALPSDRPPRELKRRLLARISSEPAIVETDVHGRITSINPAFSSLCGYSFAEIRGRKPGSFLQGAETDPATVKQLRESIARREPVEVEMINYHKDGSPYRVRISIQPLMDEAGEHRGFRAIERRVNTSGGAE